MTNNGRVCLRCGQTLSGHRNLKYCPECGAEVHRAQARECARRARTRIIQDRPTDWIGTLAEAQKTIPIRMQRIYGVRFVEMANEKIRRAQQLVEAGLA